MVDVILSNAQEERCIPLLDIRINVQENLDIPENRLELEDVIQDSIQYNSKRIFTTVIGGPAVTANMSVLVSPSQSEFWFSINSKIENLKQTLEDEGYIEDWGRDMSVTMTAGDPEIMIRQIEDSN